MNKRLIAFLSILSLFLSLPLIPVNAATKAGAKCNKTGVTSISAGKTYTCIKSGKKMVWSKGLPLSKLPVIQAVDLSKFTNITPSTELSAPDICKTVDITPSITSSNGFPRPSFSVNGKTEIKLLVLPIIFDEIPFTNTDLTNLENALKSTSEFYSKMSYGRLKLIFEIPERALWVKLLKSAKSYGIIPNLPQQNNEIIAIDAIALADKQINLSAYQSVIIESGYSSLTSIGQGMGGKTFVGKNGSVVGATLEIGEAVGRASVISHELGHNLFGLEDLYVFLNSKRPTVPEPQPAGKWDVMSEGGSLVPGFFGWNRLLMGWLPDSEIRCIKNQNSTTHFLSNIDNVTDPKLVLINVASGITIAMESRVIDSKNQGLLVYKIDSNTNHGDGPISAEKNLLSKGESIKLDNWNIYVSDTSPLGLIVKVEKST
jgi:M6 family metalloprotease-like protein